MESVDKCIHAYKCTHAYECMHAYRCIVHIGIAWAKSFACCKCMYVCAFGHVERTAKLTCSWSATWRQCCIHSVHKCVYRWLVASLMDTTCRSLGLAGFEKYLLQTVCTYAHLQQHSLCTYTELTCTSAVHMSRQTAGFFVKLSGCVAEFVRPAFIEMHAGFC